MTRRDSALEAFRHNPTDGSFAPPLDHRSVMDQICSLPLNSLFTGVLQVKKRHCRQFGGFLRVKNAISVNFCWLVVIDWSLFALTLAARH